jgi:hypothetical protein
MLFTLITRHPQALAAIVQQTPTWVWGLLAALVALGASQLRQREASAARVAVMPVAMAGLSAYGLVSGFGAAGQAAGILAAWLATAALVAAACLALAPQPPQGARYDAAARRFHLPGSAVPLALTLGIFFTKYLVGVELALQPALAHDTGLALAIAALYGLFNGVFAARALRLWRLPARAALAA